MPEASPEGRGSPAVRVRCYAGYRGEETPRSFAVGERQREVEEILGRRRGPDDRSFVVRTTEGEVWRLRCDEAGDRWEATLLERGDGPR